MATSPAELPDLERAKALLAGGLGREMAAYPLRFAIAAFFGAPPAAGEPLTVNSGSASLVNFNGRPHIVTCHHVLQGYRDALAATPGCLFHLGDCQLDPLAHLVSESREQDVAVLALADGQAKEVLQTGGDLSRHFVEPPAWPPGQVVEGDFVAFGGYPGAMRWVPSAKELSFGSFSSGATRVTAAHDDYLVCQLEREYWVKQGLEPEPATIRGLSGGPVFASRQSADTGVVWYEFVGHITEFHEDYELLYVRLASVLEADGTVRG